MKRTGTYLYITIVTVLVAAFFVVFNLFPRSTVSELENRELAKMPAFTWEKFWSGEYMSELSSWYSDSEPYRDLFMMLSMEVDKAKKMPVIGKDEDEVTFIAGDEPTEQPTEEQAAEEEVPADSVQINVEAKSKIANHGIVIVGSQPTARALMAYRGGVKSCNRFAEMANLYKKTLGEEVNVYCMIIPTAVEFYCPERAKARMKSQFETITEAYSQLDSAVVAVDVYTPLRKHRNEDIYLRTDHHWSPRGGYYAAKALAAAAGVPFNDLSHYDEHTITGYVGSMYRYSRDITVKRSPEDFVYHKPREVEYKTTYINYALDESFNITSELAPVAGNYFYTFKNGSGNAYCTFMGGDSKITQVRTSTKNGRRVIIVKDSFGNAIPGYLFYSFEEIHVIDLRYFTHNIKRYIAQNKITDVVMAHNAVFAATGTTMSAYSRFLTQ
ncbi:MAG: hypothetical protein IKL20_00955 [Alistipes sp.]|nr:hypothetical protein [Alistipes sp.]